jgi:3-phenylpropionate/trans-cinnamate dioxygenase ferredoxin subunit
MNDLPAGAAWRVVLLPHVIALFNVAGTVHAVDDRCPHEGGRLSRGTVEVASVRCPVHGARFALETGQALEPPAGEPMGPPVSEGVRLYAVRVIGDEIHVGL